MITLECNFVLNWRDDSFELLLPVFLKITILGGNNKQFFAPLDRGRSTCQGGKMSLLRALIDQKEATLHFSSLVLY